MAVTAVKTRLVHAAVRHLLPRSPHWPAVGGQKPIPISQADIMVTWHSPATFADRQLTAWRLRIPRAEWEAGVLFYLGEGQNIFIEVPAADRSLGS
jgi:hypothetical protein